MLLVLPIGPRIGHPVTHRGPRGPSFPEEVSVMHQPRLNAFAVAPGAYSAVRGVETYIQGCGLEKSLIHLVKMRASQINGCAYCLDMHSKEARKIGETEQRLYLLDAWRESPLYTPRERAALAWTEAVTRIAETGNLTTLIGLINVWNRLCVSFRTPHPVEKSAAA